MNMLRKAKFEFTKKATMKAKRAPGKPKAEQRIKKQPTPSSGNSISFSYPFMSNPVNHDDGFFDD